MPLIYVKHKPLETVSSTHIDRPQRSALRVLSQYSARNYSGAAFGTRLCRGQLISKGMCSSLFQSLTTADIQTRQHTRDNDSSLFVDSLTCSRNSRYHMERGGRWMDICIICVHLCLCKHPSAGINTQVYGVHLGRERIFLP